MKPLQSLRHAVEDLYDSATGPRLIELLAALFAPPNPDPAPSLSEARRIAVFRLDEIGDAVLTLPMLAALRAEAPAAHIDLIVAPHTADLFGACRDVDRVLVFDSGASRRAAALGRLMRSCAFVRRAFPVAPDFALAPRWDVDERGAIGLARLTGAHRRIGYSEAVNARKKRLNRGADRLLTSPICDDNISALHESERAMSVLSHAAGRRLNAAPAIAIEGADRVAAARLLAAQRPCRKWLALGASGGRSALKAWPADRYEALVRALDPDTGIVLVGSSADAPLCAELAGRFGAGRTAVVAAGKLGLRETAALIQMCAAFVGSDSGPMHIAAAAGVPTVGLFGSSCPHRFAPVGARCAVVHAQLPCGPCARDGWPDGHSDRCVRCIHPRALCMEAIEPAAVASEIARVSGLTFEFGTSPSAFPERESGAEISTSANAP